MNALSSQQSRARRPRRQRHLARWALWALILALVFGVGVAVGQALEERPRAGEPVTRTSTIRPWTQPQTRTQP